jgi:PEP-CTERM motif
MTMKANALKLIASLIVAGIAASARAQTELITFDDLPIPSGAIGTIPNGYNGLQWSNFGVHASLGFTPSGYVNGVVSAKNTAFNLNGTPAFISDGALNLNSAYLTGAWNNGLQVEVQGFVGAALTYDNIYTVNETGPTLINFNYLGVDQVNFISSGGTPVPGLAGAGVQFVMDNLSVTLVPEPSTLALAGLSGLSLLLLRRQRK